MLPPRWIRRVLLAPLVPLVTLLLLSVLPLTAIVAAFASRWLPGRWRPLRLLWFLLVYLVLESAMIVALLALWLASGFGTRLHTQRWSAAHYALLRWYLAVLVRSGRRTFNLVVDPDLTDARLAVGPGDERPPLLVFSRHAGPGDSFLLVHALLQAGFRPRVVLRSSLQWSPVIDIGLNRLPAFFVTRDAPRGTGTTAITTLAASMSGGDALVIFPEGRNFTPTRRLHSITRLEELGHHDQAEAAREMRHVLTPRSGGALAALDAAPDADVVFVAHTGLEDLSSLVDLWRGVPMDASTKVKAWRVEADQIPRIREARTAWLLWWWRQIDAWILANYGEAAIPDAAVEAVASAADEDPTDAAPV